MRLPLRAIPRDRIIRVLSGPLRGSLWVVGSSAHGCWIGWYEQAKAKAFSEAVTSESVVYDIGANVGYYTLIAARLARQGRVISFEPLPSNVTMIRRHLELNRIGNATVFEVAVSDHPGEGLFQTSLSNSMGRLGKSGDLTVRLVTIDDLIGMKLAPAPAIIKMDIEGAEYAALKGGFKTLESCRPIIFLATHGPSVHRACCKLLSDLDYDLCPIDGELLEKCSELLARPKQLAANVALKPSENEAASRC